MTTPQWHRISTWQPGTGCGPIRRQTPRNRRRAGRVHTTGVSRLARRGRRRVDSRPTRPCNGIRGTVRVRRPPRRGRGGMGQSACRREAGCEGQRPRHSREGVRFSQVACELVTTNSQSAQVRRVCRVAARSGYRAAGMLPSRQSFTRLRMLGTIGSASTSAGWNQRTSVDSSDTVRFPATGRARKQTENSCLTSPSS